VPNGLLNWSWSSSLPISARKAAGTAAKVGDVVTRTTGGCWSAALRAGDGECDLRYVKEEQVAVKGGHGIQNQERRLDAIGYAQRKRFGGLLGMALSYGIIGAWLLVLSVLLSFDSRLFWRIPLWIPTVVLLSGGL